MLLLVLQALSKKLAFQEKVSLDAWSAYGVHVFRHECWL